MAQETTNYDLIKPGYEDTADIKDINDNMDALDTILSGMKTKQTAKVDPTSSGATIHFIESLTQNANGEVTATKKRVRYFVGATSSAAGEPGLVPQPGTGDVGKYLKGDGTWGTPTNTTYSEATSSAYGLVKIGYTASGKNYPVQLSSGKMYVNVPWTDNNTTYSQATSSALGLVKIGYTASGKNYPVQLDSSGKMFVNVPWTDNNTTYSEATASAYGLIKIGYTASGKNYPVQLSGGKAFVNVPWTDTNTTYSTATADTLGLVKIGYTASGKKYPVQLSSGKMYVEVPWTDTNTTYSTATADTLGLVKIGYTASGKKYPVQLSSGKMYVEVPWVNTTYTRGEGITISNANVISRAPLMNSPAGTYGPTANVTGTEGTTIKIPQITVNEYGDVTGVVERTLTNKNTNTWRGFSVQSFNYQYTVSANGTKNITGTNFGVGKTGYTPVAVCLFNPGSTDVHVIALDINATGSNTVMTVKNMTGSSITATAYIEILYLQNS